MSMPQVTLAGKKVGKMGYGLMQLTLGKDHPSQEDSIAAMKAAADSGATAWSTATFYGNEGEKDSNIRLIKAFFDKYPEYTDKIVIVLKGGLHPTLAPYSDEEFLEKGRAELKHAQQILGNKKIDVYNPARLNPKSNIETVMGFCKTLKEEGLFGEVGLSEVKGETLEKANKIVPIAMNEIEVSLWSYEPVIQDALAVSQKLSIPVFCYSPLGRGFLTRKYKSPEDIPEGSFQRMMPRFQGQAFYDNLKLVDMMDEFAKKKNVETSQLALAWVCSLNDMTIPIPGSSKPARVENNCASASLKLSDEEQAEIQKILDSFEVKGDRYNKHGMAVLMQ